VTKAASSRPRPTRRLKDGGLPRWIRHTTRTGLYLIFDASAVTAAYWIAYRLRFHSHAFTDRFPITGIDPGWARYTDVMYIIVLLWLLLFFYSSRLYSLRLINPFDRGLRIAKAALLGTAATLVASYLYGRLEYSRLMLVLASPLAFITVALSHMIVGWIDRGLASLEAVSPLLLIGDSKVGRLVRDNILGRHPNAPIHEIAHTPSPEALIELAQKEGIQELVLTQSDVAHDKLLELAETCETLDINFRMIPDLLELRLGEVQMDESLGLPAYRLQHTQLTRANFAAKRIFDVVFSLAVLAMLGIPFIVIVLLIRLDSKGAALYKQKRIGFRGRTFWAYKFRTMIQDAEKSLGAVRELNDQKGGFFKAKSDPRITGIGRILRRYSIDEFPQFINVLKGEMSVVGPRPLAVTTGEMDQLVKQFGTTAKKRMNILPGITGLWQVSGRSDISADQRFALDMFYIEHWSLGMDLEIILKTVPAMVSGKGAY
jgi:exopolysaccharide biosynthesis polyprenyl glycosylphosphotransferase